MPSMETGPLPILLRERCHLRQQTYSMNSPLAFLSGSGSMIRSCLICHKFTKFLRKAPKWSKSYEPTGDDKHIAGSCASWYGLDTGRNIQDGLGELLSRRAPSP